MDGNQEYSRSEVEGATCVEGESRGHVLQASPEATIRGITLSYGASLEVYLKDGSKKLILDDTCGTVAPGQVLCCTLPCVVTMCGRRDLNETGTNRVIMFNVCTYRLLASLCSTG